MTKKLSIIIPTLQKNIEFLNQLTDILVAEDSVGEVIIIDNSTKGYRYDNEKVRTIVPKENLFVNPSWNLGVNEVKSDYIGILNDDICIPRGFCGKILNEISKDIGIIGTNGYMMINKSFASEEINDDSFVLEQVSYMPFNYGVMLFFHKDNYYEIPDDLKIYYGDNYLFAMNKKNKMKNYVIEKLKMYHYGSLSSKSFSDLINKENSIFKKYTLSLLDRVFSIEITRTKINIHFMFFTFGINKRDKRYINIWRNEE